MRGVAADGVVFGLFPALCEEMSGLGLVATVVVVHIWAQAARRVSTQSLPLLATERASWFSWMSGAVLAPAAPTPPSFTARPPDNASNRPRTLARTLKSCNSPQNPCSEGRTHPYAADDDTSITTLPAVRRDRSASNAPRTPASSKAND